MATRRSSIDAQKKAAAAERRASLEGQEDEVQSVDSRDGSPQGEKLVGATKSVRLDPYGRVVRPGYLNSRAILEYYMNGPPRSEDDENVLGLNRGGTVDKKVKEALNKVVYAIFDDRFFLYDAFTSLDSDGGGLLSEDQMAHWVSCISTCSPVAQATTAPPTRCEACKDRGFTPYRCQCVPRALPQSNATPDIGRAAEWKELGPPGTEKKERVGWTSEALASATLQDLMKDIIEDCLQKRAPVAPELAGDAPPVVFDWHDFIVVTMDFYVALGVRSMHAIYTVLLGNECDELAPALEPKTDPDPSGEDDGGATRPAAKASFDGGDAVQQIGTESSGGIFACFRTRKDDAAAVTATRPGSAAKDEAASS